jgi:hypothetical protein
VSSKVGQVWRQRFGVFDDVMLVLSEERGRLTLLNLETGQIDYGWSWALEKSHHDVVWTRVA